MIFAVMNKYWLLILLMLCGCQNFKYYDPQKPHRGPDGFLNNYDNSPHESVLKWQWNRLIRPHQRREFNPEILRPDVEFLKTNRQKNTLTWFGHSSSLLQIAGVNILIDPVFSQRASPVSFMGPKRYSANPLEVSELPEIELIFISHNHYDHLDIETLTAVAKRNPQAHFLVALGDGDILRKKGIQNVHEMDWWETFEYEGLTVTFTPSQHWSQRWIFRPNQSLWGGFHIGAPHFKMIYVGDTGYSKDFQDIYDKLGEVDLALIPVGAYEPRWFMKRQHVNPPEAVQIHKDLHARLSIGVHWGTFRLTDENLIEPVEELAKVLESEPLQGSEFKVLKHGETLFLQRKYEDEN